MTWQEGKINLFANNYFLVNLNFGKLQNIFYVGQICYRNRAITILILFYCWCWCSIIFIKSSDYLSAQLILRIASIDATKKIDRASTMEVGVKKV